MGTIGMNIYNNMKGDKVIWMIVLLLGIFSLLAVYSASGTLAYSVRGGNVEYYLFRHGTFILAGLGLTVLCYRLHYMQYSKWAPILFLVAIPLLIYTMFYGANLNEARRWIQIPFIDRTFQTSDFAKLALIIYVARAISDRQDYIKDLRSAFIPIIMPVIIVCGLIAPADLSTAGLLFTTCLFMMVIGRVQLKYIFLLIALGVVLMALLIAIGSAFPEMVRVDTWTSRIQEFIHGSDGYQVQQAKIAIANGGWFGEGPGNSVQRNFLPLAYADFIYAIICEEYGIIGAFMVMVLYLLLFVRCTGLVTRFPKAFGAMLAIGLSLNLVIQAFLNIAVSVDLVPVTGLTLPMISMGGTSTLFTCIAFGIILSVSRYLDRMRELELQAETAAADAGGM
jgi:cell division protein FtsW